MKQKISKPFIFSAGILVCSAIVAGAQTTVFSESFDPAPSTLSEFNMQLGGTPALKPANTRIFPLGQWGLTSNGMVVDIGGANGHVLQPQLDDKNNGRCAGIFLDPALFAATGAGTYTLTFDVIPSSTAGAGRVYVGAGSGYDLSGATDAKLNLALAPDGFGVRRATGLIIWPALTASGGATATHLITTTTEWILADDTPTGQFREAPGAPFDVETAATLSVDFEYDGSSAVVIAFGGYNTDVKVDNITVSTAAPAPTSWAGYPIGPDGFVDTGNFLGWIWVGETGDFVWSVDLGKFIYVPEEFVGASGGWTYIYK